MKTAVDVVVIGAGIQGLSAAYHLAKMGMKQVCVVEKAHIGAGSSGRSASMLMKQLDYESNIRLALVDFEHYLHFQEETGVDPEFKRIGFLGLFPESVKEQGLEAAHLRQRLGVQTEIWPPDEIKKRLPFIHVDDVAFGVYGHEDGMIDAHAIMQGYAAAARRLGVEINQGVQAVGIDVHAGRVAAVNTTAGRISTRWVVNAAGADAIEVGQWVGLKLPISNRRRNIYMTHEFPHIPADSPMVEDMGMEWYYRREGPGVLIGMGKEESSDASDVMNADFLPQTIDFAIHRVPILAEASILRGWSGIRPLTPDSRPIIGPVEGVEGFVNSCGWGGEGVMHAPSGGQLVSEYITSGTTTPLALTPFLLSRFSPRV